MKKQTVGEEKKNTISIIIPVYNTAHYLKKCLDSILCNTYKNCEIICVNDGSTDDSLEILNVYAEKDSRIRIINIPNGGVSKARNIGLAEAKGEYIAFVDSDDWIDPTLYSRLFQLSKGNCQLLICGMYLNYSEEQSDACNADNMQYDLTRDEALSMTYSREHFKGFLWNKIFLNSIIKDNKLVLDESIGYCEDLLFVTEYLLLCDSIFYLSVPLYHYRIRKGSATEGGNHNNTFTGVKAYQRIVQILKNHSIDEKIVNCAISRIPSIAVKSIQDMALSNSYDAFSAKLYRDSVLNYREYYLSEKGIECRVILVLLMIHPRLLCVYFKLKRSVGRLFE